MSATISIIRKMARSIHPGKFAAHYAALPKQINGEYNEQYRIIRGGREIRWINHQAFPICNQEGDIYRIAGNC